MTLPAHPDDTQQGREHQPGFGIDRTQIRELLKLTYAERLAQLQGDAAGLAEFDRAVQTARRPKDVIEVEVLEGLRLEIDEQTGDSGPDRP